MSNFSTWLPIGLPNNVKLLTEMLRWERMHGKDDMIKAMERKLTKLKEAK